MSITHSVYRRPMSDADRIRRYERSQKLRDLASGFSLASIPAGLVGIVYRPALVAGIIFLVVSVLLGRRADKVSPYAEAP